jgi:protein-S-isoprenylcysteine O-methyltransferase Ste14
MSWRTTLRRRIRPSTSRSTAALWAKSLLNALLFFAVFMVALPWLAHRLLPAPLPLPAALGRWLGGAAALAGASAWILCLDAFSRRGRGTPLPLDAPRKLVTTGLFGLIRNPIMVAELLVMWGIALHLASWGAALYALLMCVAAHWAVVHVEEPELRARFGESYGEYCRRVPRWLPRLRGS